MPGESRLSAPAGFVELLREMVMCGQGDGIVAALREREEFEKARAVKPHDREQRRVARLNIRRIAAFLAGAAVEEGGAFAVTVHAEAVALVRLGFARRAR